MHSRKLFACFLYLAVLAIAIAPLYGQLLQGQNDWPNYGGDPGHMKYSALKQITPQNVSKLQVAWTYKTGDKGIGEWEDTPLVVNGVMYAETGKQRVVALEPETGSLFGSSLREPPVTNPRESRGVSYWPGDANNPPRLVYGTTDGRLITIDCKTGKVFPRFGRNGYVDLRVGVAEEPYGNVSVSSPPAIYKNLAIVGNELQESPRVDLAGLPEPTTS